MKYLDIPPAWLLAALLITARLGHSRPFGLSFGEPWADFLGGLLIGGGLVLMVLAIIEMRKWRTTVVPHQIPARLVTSGIFKRSRNPIYLGDMLILGGAILALNAPLALPLIPVLFWLLETRFVLPEEARLRRTFGAEFHRYTKKTPRWFAFK